MKTNNSYSLLAYLKWIIVPFILIACGVKLLLPEEVKYGGNEQFEYISEYTTGLEKARRLAHLIADGEIQGEWQFAFAECWHKYRSKDQVFLRDELIQQSKFPPLLYEGFIKSASTHHRNQGYLGLAAHAFEQELYSDAIGFLDSISGFIPGKIYLLGKLNLKQGKWKDARKCFLIELDSGRMNERVNDELIRLKIRRGRFQSLSEDEIESLSSVNRRFHYLTQSSFLNYGFEVFRSIPSRVGLMGLIASLLVTLVWLTYFIQIGNVGRVNALLLIASVAIGSLSVVFATVMYDMGHWLSLYPSDDNFYGQLANSILRIGLIEELSKLLVAVLLLFGFRRFITSPIQWILVASSVGLGFSFIEDSYYFTSRSLSIVSSRTLISGALHMCWTSIALYGLVEWKFRGSDNRKKLRIVGFFTLAMILHGLFDHWLIYYSSIDMLFISILIAIYSIYLWVRILTNGLNNSFAFKNRQNLNLSRLNFYLVAGFTSVILVEYILNSAILGTGYSDLILMKGAKLGVFLIPFLAFRLSRVSLSEGGWLPLTIETHRYVEDVNDVLDRNAVLKPYRTDGLLGKLLPTEINIKDRITVKNDSDWYLAVPIESNPKFFGFLIKRKELSSSLLDSNVMVHCRLVKTEALLKEANSLKSFPFLGWALLGNEK